MHDSWFVGGGKELNDTTTLSARGLTLGVKGITLYDSMFDSGKGLKVKTTLYDSRFDTGSEGVKSESHILLTPVLVRTALYYSSFWSERVQ